MAKAKIQQETDGNWVVVSLPESYKEGDLLPPPSASDRRFATEAETLAELNRRLGLVPDPTT